MSSSSSMDGSDSSRPMTPEKVQKKPPPQKRIESNDTLLANQTF
jgi:hypothetical protein